MACNRQPCPAAWVAGSWGRCGDTCAQTREVSCRQQLAGGVSIPVSRELCPAPAPASARPCEQSACPQEEEAAPAPAPKQPDVMATQPQPRALPGHTAPAPTDWVAQGWGPCSVTCGHGVKERQVTHVSLYSGWSGHTCHVSLYRLLSPGALRGCAGRAAA